MAEKRKRGCWFYFACFMGLGLICNVLVAVFGPGPNGKQPQPTPTETHDPLLEADAKRLMTATAAAMAVRDAMRDPDSFVLESAQTNETATLACIAYRARNGFGGMNREVIAYKNGKPKQGSGFWNSNCAKQQWEMTDRVKRRL